MNNRTVRAIAMLCLFSAAAMIAIGYCNRSWLVAVYGGTLAAFNAWLAVHYHRKVRKRNRRAS